MALLASRPLYSNSRGKPTLTERTLPRMLVICSPCAPEIRKGCPPPCRRRQARGAEGPYFFLSNPGEEMYRPAHSKNAGKLGTLVWPPSCCRQASSPPMRVLTAGILSVR